MLLFLQLHYSGEKITLLLVTVDGTKTHIHFFQKKLTAIAENRSDNVHVRQKAAQLHRAVLESAAGSDELLG